MPGRPITTEQLRIYMDHREESGQQVAAAKAGISPRSARRIDRRGGRLVEPQARTWRTRSDPLDGVWDGVVEPLLVREAGGIQATALLRHLQQLHPGRFPDGTLRTLQRRLAAWHLEHGAEPELIFRQEPVPGRMGLSDFTVADDLGVTVGGQAQPHRLYHFRLAYSGWCSASVVLGGESFTALAEGLRAALAALGAVPHEHRTDSLSAAFRNLTADQAVDQTRAYAALMASYGMRPTRNNPGESHENGAIESPQGHLKRALADALVLRGGRDFATLDDYRAFVDRVVAGIRARLPAERVATERAALKPLPAVPPSPEAMVEELAVKVCSTGTCVVRKQLCTVPARYAGKRLRVLVHDDRLEFLHQGVLILTTARRRPAGNERTHSIDYRHVIESLAKKPGAFPNCQLRDHLHPNATWRVMWEALRAGLSDERSAAVVYLEAMLLAHRHACEQQITGLFAEHLAARTLPTREALRERFRPQPQPLGDHGILIVLPGAAGYDDLLLHARVLQAAITIAPTAADPGGPTQDPPHGRTDLRHPPQPPAQPPPAHHGPALG